MEFLYRPPEGCTKAESAHNGPSEKGAAVSGLPKLDSRSRPDCPKPATLRCFGGRFTPPASRSDHGSGNEG